MNDEDYKARDSTINYTGLNSSFLLEDIYPQTKKYLNINGKTSFLSPSMYYHKQVHQPPQNLLLMNYFLLIVTVSSIYDRRT